jgi:membrane-bound lytic murein transglycosylase B
MKILLNPNPRPLLCALVCAAALVAQADTALEAAPNAVPNAAANPSSALPAAPFPAWLAEFRLEAQAQGISQATLDAALGDVQPLLQVLELDRRQPEFVDTFRNYLDKRVSPQRLERGMAALTDLKPLLDEVEAKYGVPASILVAFWGLETNYGGFLGNHAIPAALATLAFDTRRSDFFRRELLQALRLIDAGHVTAENMKGSWAGAMGQVQFMPSTYMHYAVDGDGDGRKDLWNSLPDAFHSAAHYLRDIGWQAGQTWGREVRLPADFDSEQAGQKVKRRVRDWAALGVTKADGSPLPTSTLTGAIVLPQGHAGPAFLVYRNFEVIMAWNRSLNYALAVGHLADRFLGLPGVQGGSDADNRPLSREQVMEIQRLLASQGLDVGEADGLPGRQTRQAIRDWQKSAGLPADGYASVGLLEQLLSAP